MTYKYRILKSANDELDDIILYLSKNSKSAARKFIDAYEHQLDLICSGKVSYGLSRMQELARLGYHTALVGNYMFFHYIENKTIVVAHIFHQRRDYSSIVAPAEE